MEEGLLGHIIAPGTVVTSLFPEHSHRYCIPVLSAEAWELGMARVDVFSGNGKAEAQEAEGLAQGHTDK